MKKWQFVALVILIVATGGVGVKAAEWVLSQPFLPVKEVGLTELVGINEQVDQNDFSASVSVNLGYPAPSGEFRSFCFYADEAGSGAIQDSAGILYIYDGDVNIASGATAMTAVTSTMSIGQVVVYASDWDTDATSGTACIHNTVIPFHSTSRLIYFAWKQTDATGLNDAAGDDEGLDFNAWWVPYSDG